MPAHGWYTMGEHGLVHYGRLLTVFNLLGYPGLNARPERLDDDLKSQKPGNGRRPI